MALHTQGITMSKHALNAVLTQRVEIAPDLIIIRVVPDGWELPEFKPGQFAVLGLPESASRCAGALDPARPAKPNRLIRRSYSIASSSVAREHLEFYVSLVRRGTLTPRLFGLEAGDRLWLGPRITGTFTLDQVPAQTDLILVATGTGLAPYMSMLRTALPGNGHRRVAVLLGARGSCGLGYHAELAQLQRLTPGLVYLPTISRPGGEPTPWKGHTGHVQDLWRNGVLEAEWGLRPTPAETRVFLCGNPGMISDMSELLAAEGFSENSRKSPGEVFVEKYW